MDLFNRKPKEDAQDNPTDAGVVITALQGHHAKPISETETRKEIALEYLLAEAKKIHEVLEKIETCTINIPRRTPDTGLIFYESQTTYRMWVLNLQLLSDDVIASLINSMYEAETMKMRLHYGCMSITEQMEKREYDPVLQEEFGTLIFNFETVMRGVIEGTVNGNKALLMKTDTQSLKVTMNRGLLPKGEKPK